VNENFNYYSSAITQYQQHNQNVDLARLLGAQQCREIKKMPDGSKPVVICRGVAEEAKDMDAAQALAEAKAHEHSADAYILKPVKRVAPKRDVVTTDLP